MLSYIPGVAVEKIRLWTPDRPNRDGSMPDAVRYLVFRDEKGEQFELPLHESLNGHSPQAGEVVGLVVHSYSWEQAKVSQRTQNPYIDRTEKRRIVGTFDAAKFVAPVNTTDAQFLPAAA